MPLVKSNGWGRQLQRISVYHHRTHWNELRYTWVHGNIIIIIIIIQNSSECQQATDPFLLAFWSGTKLHEDRSEKICFPGLPISLCASALQFNASKCEWLPTRPQLQIPESLDSREIDLFENGTHSNLLSFFWYVLFIIFRNQQRRETELLQGKQTQEAFIFNLHSILASLGLSQARLAWMTLEVIKVIVKCFWLGKVSKVELRPYKYNIVSMIASDNSEAFTSFQIIEHG